MQKAVLTLIGVNKKIMTEKEYNKLETFLVKATVETLNITEKAAKLRIKALVKSNILLQFKSSDSLEFKIAIDTAMKIPQLSEE